MSFYFSKWRCNYTENSSNQLTLARDLVRPLNIKVIVLKEYILKETRALSIRTSIMFVNVCIRSKFIGLESESGLILNMDNNTFSWNDAFSIKTTLPLHWTSYGVEG